MTARDPIKLRDAPARLLKTDWLRLMEGSDAKAIETLSHPDPGMLVYYRRQVVARRRWLRRISTRWPKKLIASFRELGASWQIIGDGIY